MGLICPSQETLHDVTRSVSPPPGWDADQTQDTHHEVTSGVLPPLPPPPPPPTLNMICIGWDTDPSQVIQHEVTWSGWDACPCQVCEDSQFLPTVP